MKNWNGSEIKSSLLKAIELKMKKTFYQELLSVMSSPGSNSE